MRKDRIREKETRQRKTMRIAAASQSHRAIFDEPDSQELLQTNYIGPGTSRNQVKPFLEENEGNCVGLSLSSRQNKSDDNEGRTQSQSSINLVFTNQNGKSRTPKQEISVIDVLGSLFTSNKNSLPATIMTGCCSPLVDSFELILGFNQEAFTGILDLMLTALLQKRRINEMKKIEIMTKYEQIFYENIPKKDSHEYTTKMHFVLAKLKSEISDCLRFQSSDEEKKIETITVDLAKFMCMFQKEMILEGYTKDIFEVFVLREFGLANCIVDRWLSLELMRYRLSIIHDSTSSIMKNNKQNADVCSRILNEYIKNVFETMSNYCKDYETDLSSFMETISRESSNNMKQNLMELDVQRKEKRCQNINDLESFSKKAVTNFFFSQNEMFIDSYKTFVDIMCFVDTESIKRFVEFQKSYDKKLMRLLKSCEENLFSSCEQDELVSEADLVQISKEMTTSLRDFRAAHQEMKTDLLKCYEDNIVRISCLLQKIYAALQEKYLQSMEDLRGTCMETLHALSNLQEDDMNEIESDFEIAFWSMNFNSYFTTMSEIVNKFHTSIERSISTNLAKDISYSLEDMTQILKQDKSVLSRASLFSKPDPNFYLKIETELLKSVTSLVVLVDENTDEITTKLDAFVLKQCSEVIHKTNNWQSKAYFMNCNATKESLWKCNTDSRGYTSKSGSTLVKSFSQKVGEIWQSQADFKSLKLKESYKSTMKDYSFESRKYFENKQFQKPMENSFESFEEIFDLEYSAYFTFEKHDKSNSIKGVLDANLENELMIVKFGEKINALNATYCDGSGRKVNNSDGMQRKVKKRKQKSGDLQRQSMDFSEKSKLNPLLASSKKKSLKK